MKTYSYRARGKISTGKFTLTGTVEAEEAIGATAAAIKTIEATVGVKPETVSIREKKGAKAKR